MFAEAGLGEAWRAGSAPEDEHESAQKPLEPSDEQAEVVTSGGEHGVGAVAVAALEIVAAHAGLGFNMADHGFDGGASAHLAADRLGDAPHLAGDPDLELVRMVMAAITLVEVHAAHLDAGELLQIGDHTRERVAVEWVAVQGLGVQHELAT